MPSAAEAAIEGSAAAVRLEVAPFPVVMRHDWKPHPSRDVMRHDWKVVPFLLIMPHDSGL